MNLAPVTSAGTNGQIPALVHALARGMVEQRAQLADRAVYDQLLVQMLLRYAQAERELRDLNALKNRFLGIAAHDLRNPLSGIRGLAELLLTMDMEPDQRQEMLAEIHRTADEMLRLVNDLLDVAVVESGRLELRCVPTDVSRLIAARVKLALPAAQRKDISVSTVLPEGLRATIDPDRCAQVVDNLLSNAIKFSPSGTAVHASLAGTPDEVVFAVRDSGPGIAAEDRKKLFGTFQKLAARPTGGETSTGLGLAIVRQIVDAHHGSIDVTDAPAGGAEFVVHLPKEPRP